jgi:hypothetical protein
MAQRLEVPKFANESEEARWWFDNRDAVADEFELAEREGRLGRGSAARLANAISLDPEDAVRARSLAQQRGLDYEAYVKMVVHQALLTEEKGLSRG